MKRKAVPLPGGGPLAELETTTDSEEAPRRASVHLGAVDTASSPFGSDAVAGLGGSVAGDGPVEETEQQPQQPQEVVGDSGTSRMSVVVNGTPPQQSRGQAGGQSRGAETATGGSEEGVDDDPGGPPAVFVQASVSSLDSPLLRALHGECFPASAANRPT